MAHRESIPRAMRPCSARGLASLSKGEVWVIHLRERETVGRTGLLTSRESEGESETDVTSAVDTLTNTALSAASAVQAGNDFFANPQVL